MQFVIRDLPGIDQCVSAKNDEIVSGLKLGLWEGFSKFETLEVEFEAFVCPSNFGLLSDLSFWEIMTQQLEHVYRSLKVLVGFLRRIGLSLRSAEEKRLNHRCY